MIDLKIKKLHKDAKIPTYGSAEAAGFDLVAIEDQMVYSLTTVRIRTGLSFEIPEGYELQIRPRSGMTFRTSFRIANSPGTIDSDYTGELCILGQTDFNTAYKVKKGDKIAQAVLAPVIKANLVELKEGEPLKSTERGSGGFGSTDKGNDTDSPPETTTDPTKSPTSEVNVEPPQGTPDKLDMTLIDSFKNIIGGK